MVHEQSATTPRPVNSADYWLGVVMLLFVAEFFIAIAALCYGIITTPPTRPGQLARIVFPWMGWLTAALMAPAVILGGAQIVARRSGQGEMRAELGLEAEQTGDASEWEKTLSGYLPDRAVKAYRFIKDAPLYMICAAFVALGATLLLIDGAFLLAKDVLLALAPYLPYFIAAVTALAIAVASLMAWFKYKNNQLMADYAFRREVLEKTGIILLNNAGKAILPPGGGGAGYAVGLLPPAQDAEAGFLEATPVERIADVGGDSAETAGPETNIRNNPL